MPTSAKLGLVVIIAMAAVATAFAFAGRYHVTTIRQGSAGSYVMMVDRFTGTAYGCTDQRCWRIERQ